MTVSTSISNRAARALGSKRAACALACWLFVALHGAPLLAQDMVVNTEHQMKGVAPRLEVELGANFLMGLGRACRGDGAVSPCSNNFAAVGGQMLGLVRPWNHLAFGPVLAFDTKIGRQRFSVEQVQNDSSIAAANVDYTRHQWRLLFEARWYQHRVSVGGLFVSFQAGVTWFTDTLKPMGDIDQSLTQSAPIFGLGIGGNFVPYRGIGMSLAVQSYLAMLPTTGPRFDGAFSTNTAYGYGTFAFVGLTLSLATGVSL